MPHGTRQVISLRRIPLAAHCLSHYNCEVFISDICVGRSVNRTVSTSLIRDLDLLIPRIEYVILYIQLILCD